MKGQASVEAVGVTPQTSAGKVLRHANYRQIHSFVLCMQAELYLRNSGLAWTIVR